MAATIGTINDEGKNVDLYIPRKCHATNTLISSYDYSSIQIAIAEIDPNGVFSNKTKTFCIAGYLRGEGESDHAINRLCISAGIIRPKSGKPQKNKKKPAKIAKPSKAAPAKKAATKAPVQKPSGKAGAKKPTGKQAVKPAGKKVSSAPKTTKPATGKTGNAAAAAPAKPKAAKTQARPKSAPATKH